MLVNLTISTTLRPSVLHQTVNGESRSAGEGSLNLTQEIVIVGFVEQESEIGSAMEGVRALPKGAPRLFVASGRPTRRLLQTVEKVPGILLAFKMEQKEPAFPSSRCRNHPAIRRERVPDFAT